MVLSWTQRLTQLSILIGTDVVADDEDRQGQVLDEYLASQTEDKQDDINTLRFNDDDLSLIGRLAVGQFGTVGTLLIVDVVRCHLDSRVYVRKTMEKRIILRARAQCSPQFERDILVKALKANSVWVPHLICAFQTEVSLKLVMHYADRGNMWDVIESSPEGKLPESDLRWWIPQMISAIEWCHSQGFAHRDIKPHNFVITPTSHLLLVDFGSAAPLHPATSSGVQLVPQEYCLVPCGTCDYISPEILQCHEAALVALELEDDGETIGTGRHTANATCYGRETDWWSFGAMVYEMAFGIAPFFANDVGRTYVKIINHRTSLKFDGQRTLSNLGISLLQGLLCDKEQRLGRHSIAELKTHQYLEYVDWNSLRQKNPPSNLHLPHFTYSTAAPDHLENGSQPKVEEPGVLCNESEQFSRPFEFSALFKSSQSFSGPSFLEAAQISTPPSNINRATSSFIGFSWGPRINALNPPSTNAEMPPPILHQETANPTPRPTNALRSTNPLPLLGVDANNLRFLTPIRRTSLPIVHGHTVSIPRTIGTGRRIQGRRILSDREAMQQLVECVGLSAHKKVLESGKKP
ncbi:kinase-like domain-containing protein, partial [Hysterangium stoloniferum]